MMTSRVLGMHTKIFQSHKFDPEDFTPEEKAAEEK
jgi:hypothetical protein